MSRKAPMAAWAAAGGLAVGLALASGVAALRLRTQHQELDEARLGLFNLPTRQKGGETVLPLVLRTTPVCGRGDLDFVQAAAARVKGARLVVSLESWQPGARSKPLASAAFEPAAVDSGEPVLLPLPASREPREVALLVCTDWGRTNSCAGKPSYGASALGGDGDRVVDQILSVHWLALAGGSAQVAQIFPWPNGFTEHAKRKGLGERLGLAARLLWALKPQPLDLRDDVTGVALTRTNSSLCKDGMTAVAH